MSKYEKYFLMKTSEVIEYITNKLDFFDSTTNLKCDEIGDGNINYVFRVYDTESNKSIIVKQAGNTARISDDFKLSTDRARIEAEILKIQYEFTPDLVPQIYLYDEVMFCVIMEDLSNYEMMRTALINFNTFPLFSEHISIFLATTLLMTSDVVLDHKEKKRMQQRFVNPELCEITEDLVYTEPYNDYNHRNDPFPENKEWIEKEIYNDTRLSLEATKLKFDFLCNTQALIHGDLHTGSVFITKEKTKVFDPEFAFFGPMGYDVGNVIANLIFAWARASVFSDTDENAKQFIPWVTTTIEEVIDKFKTKFKDIWMQKATEITAKSDEVMNWYLDTVIRDTAAVCGLELCRRIIGLAHVADITSISNPELRIKAERACLSAGKLFIMNRHEYKVGSDFINTIAQQKEIFF